MAITFSQVLLWTLIWAFFATFINYFLGMLVAVMINKKGHQAQEDVAYHPGDDHRDSPVHLPAVRQQNVRS